MGILKRRMNKIVRDVDGMKVDFQDALEQKGIEEPGNSLPAYPEKILEIEQGGGGAVGNDKNRVRFFDFDGTLLQETVVEDGAAVIAPANPQNRPEIGLAFREWGCNADDLAHVYSDLDIVAVYESDGVDNVALALRVTVAAGGTATIPFIIGTTATAYQIKWGTDGTWEDVTDVQSRTFADGFDGWVLLRHASGDSSDATEVAATTGSPVKGLVVVSGTFVCQNVTSPIAYCEFIQVCHGVTYTGVQNNDYRNILNKVSSLAKILTLCQTGTVDIVTFVHENTILGLPYFDTLYFVGNNQRKFGRLYGPSVTTISGNPGTSAASAGDKSFEFGVLALPRLATFFTGNYKTAFLSRLSIKNQLYCQFDLSDFAGVCPEKIAKAISSYSAPSGGLSYRFPAFATYILSSSMSLNGFTVPDGGRFVKFIKNDGTAPQLTLGISYIRSMDLSAEWFQYFFTLLANNTGTINMGQNYYRVPDTVKAIATGKGYTLTAS